MKAEAESKPYDDINITPMLDLSYVLLVIFIIMTTASVQGLKVALPKATAKPSLAKPSTKAVTVTGDGKLFLDTLPCASLAELKQRLQAQQAVTPDFPVVIRGDGATEYHNVVEVLNLLGELNLDKVGLATKTLKQ